jgi:hypothetical protein
MPTIPRRLASAIEAFKVAHPAYGTAKGARDNCVKASGQFIDLLLARGIRSAYVDELDVVDGVAHKAVVVHGMWVDWTARQFDRRADWPKIIPCA